MARRGENHSIRRSGVGAQGLLFRTQEIERSADACLDVACVFGWIGHTESAGFGSLAVVPCAFIGLARNCAPRQGGIHEGCASQYDAIPGAETGPIRFGWRIKRREAYQQETALLPSRESEQSMISQLEAKAVAGPAPASEVAAFNLDEAVIRLVRTSSSHLSAARRLMGTILTLGITEGSAGP
jgi:hypothetical protein